VQSKIHPIVHPCKICGKLTAWSRTHWGWGCFDHAQDCNGVMRKKQLTNLSDSPARGGTK